MSHPSSSLVLAAVPAHAQRQYRFELGASAAYYAFDDKTELDNAFGGSLRAGYWIIGPLSVEVEGSYAKPKTTSSLNNSVDVKSLGGWALLNVPFGKSASGFLKGGYASVTYGSGCPSVSVPGAGPCGTAGAIQGGAGVRIALTPTLMMRYEGMVNQSQTFLKFSNIAVHGGLSVMIGSKPLVDSDGDRVYDRSDQCAGTPAGALVDKHGCPTDTDADGVADGLDRCPDTLEGAKVNDAGCTSDSDADGVLDGIDQCADTPVGATVNDTGCPLDADNDGVLRRAGSLHGDTRRHQGRLSRLSQRFGQRPGVRRDRPLSQYTGRHHGECTGLSAGSGYRQGRRPRRAGQMPEYTACHRSGPGWVPGRGSASAEAATAGRGPPGSGPRVDGAGSSLPYAERRAITKGAAGARFGRGRDAG